MNTAPVRVLALWSPDWPVTAAARAAHVPPHHPAAVVAGNRVLACSAVARSHGVRRGLRRREAQARCPELAVLARDPDRDARAFEPVVVAVEELAPGVEIVRPGLLALPAQGPVGWFGGEQAAAERLVDRVAARTGVECQVGVADGLFAAVLAARRGLAVGVGDTPAFLAPLGVEELDREPEVDRSELVDLLRRLGLRSLGAFGALAAEDVASRFGTDAVLGHRLARGLDPRPPVRRSPPEELAVELELDPPVDRVDAAAFAARGLAERLHRTLAGHGLSCTRLGIAARTTDGEVLHRIWRCAEPLTPAGTVDRVRWQLDAWLTQTRRLRSSSAFAEAAALDGGLASSPAETRRLRSSSAFAGAAALDGGLASSPARGGAGAMGWLRLVPEETVTAGALQLGLWGEAGEADARAGRAMVRVQTLLGPDAVVTAELVGGRDPAEQVRLVPWGDERQPPPAPEPAPPSGPPAVPPPRVEQPPDPHRAPAGWPDDVLRRTGRVSAAQPPASSPGHPRPSNARRRPPARRSTGHPRSSGAVREPAPSWPGRVPAPSPATVPPVPIAAELADAGGAPVGLADPDLLTAPPHRVSVDGGPVRGVRGWAGPWPLRQRWWVPGAVEGARLQVALDDGTALLLLAREGRWWVTGVYD